VEIGVHLPLIAFGDDALSLGRLERAADAAAGCGLAALAANDHFVFATPWLDGPTALAAVTGRSGELDLMTSVALVALRGPVPLAKTLQALDVLSGGRVIAAVGPGSSARDYEALGVPFEERWPRFEAAAAALRALLRDEAEPRLAPRRGAIPVWIGSWGSAAGLRRVARLADGWLASAYNTTPERFAVARADLARSLATREREAEGFPNALSTMWTWITERRADAGRVLRDVLSPMLKRDPDVLRDQLCVGPPEHCAALLSRYAAAGCGRVLLWPIGDEPRQIELAAERVLPAVVP
jgi:alkanesulfonate monooxygenase SsuD/methylene tetrahydromethanopterin reductase-like flavin-dependent oxidoreductase (luciferase family)